MLRYVVDSFESFVDDSRYYFKRAGAYMLGKNAIVGGVNLALAMLMGATDNLVTRIMSAGLIGGISAGLAQVDHQHRNWLLLEGYREEIATSLGKKPNEVTEEDMRCVAEGGSLGQAVGNPTIKDALTQSRMARNIGVFVSAAASIAAFALVGYYYSHSTWEVMKHTVEAISGNNWMDAAGKMLHLAEKSVVGLASYLVVKVPLHWVAAEIFDMERITVNDRINQMKRGITYGHAVTQEQVMNVFVASRPQLAKQIEAEYGEKFSELDRGVKKAVLRRFDEQLALERLAEDINLGRIKPQELGFIVYDQHSGVPRHEVVKPQKTTTPVERLLEHVQAEWKDVKTTAYNAEQKLEHEAVAAEQFIEKKVLPVVLHPSRLGLAPAQEDALGEPAHAARNEAETTRWRDHARLTGRAHDSSKSFAEQVGSGAGGLVVGA